MTNVHIAILSYNESRNFPDVVRDLQAAFKDKSEVALTIFVIDNGSKDDTQTVIDGLMAEYPNVRKVTVKENKGYGYGVQQGLDALDADIMGYMWGDNQFDAAIVAELVDSFDNNQVQMAKTYRAKRHDGGLRVLVSGFYQLMFRLLYGVFTRDINSGPKLFRRELLSQIRPFRYTDWFIDAEIMIKVSRILKRDQIKELPIIFRERKHGKTNVRAKDCVQFFYNLITYKLKK